MTKKLAVVETPKPLRLDIGCGLNKRKDGEWVGVDCLPLEGVDVVRNLALPWPWDTDSIEEVNCSHFLEHLTNLDDKWERVHFFNELYRVMKPGAKCTLVIPHWCSNRYYGDPTHKEPFSEMGFYYLSREWRVGDKEKNAGANAPHVDISNNPNGYDCNFVATWGYSMNPSLHARNVDFQQFALQNYKEAAMDIIATLVKA